jgi:protein-S-isoprenylcysteine O-methyltransferase Ste14
LPGPALRRRDGGIAWAGAALFAGSLAYFLFSYAVTFGEIATGPVAAGDVLTNLALFAGFGAHHSIFARERVRDWMSRAVSPSLERSVYVWIASLMLIGVCALWRPIPGLAWELSGSARWLLHALQVAGVWLTLRSAAIIDVWDLAGVRQVATPVSRLRPTTASTSRDLPAAPWEFKTDGPYGWVRHPIYLGWMLIVFSVPTMTMTRLTFALFSSAYLVAAIPFEEASLRRASGGAYDAYMERVAWKLIPGVF